MKRSIILATTMFLDLAGCTVGPNYKRPVVPVPTSFRTAEPITTQQAGSLADLKWFEVFKDDRLQELIRAALSKNYDLRDAAARVEEAQAFLDRTKSNQLPSFATGASLDFNRISRDGATKVPSTAGQTRTFGTATVALLSFEIDAWGRLRRATEASRANLLAAEE